jgi:D-glycero-D-manno-heptose 1,7-bisphosphate phosphatase
MSQALVILDRDGVINEDSDDYIKSLDEWRPILGSIEAIARLSQAGYRVVVVTNQSGLARL